MNAYEELVELIASAPDQATLARYQASPEVRARVAALNRREKAAGFLFTLADGKATRVPVKYGFNDGTSVEILEGIAEGARVIVPGKVALVSGQAVTAVEAK